MGVNVQRIEKASPQDGRAVYLSVWDFAGQHMEYATHQFFLKTGGIFLIVWKARVGSDYGQKDLWYWLELLRMRVKDPHFLLVITHTAKTPTTVDLREIQLMYPGYEGHFEVELSDGTGLPALEKKILELVSVSPAMKAAWPASWLAVRDAVREKRTTTPYISAPEFWKLCVKFEIHDEQMQRDLADQLDKLGEIVYYASDPLSSFVILDPSWVTELVAKVLRDRPIRDHGGKLKSTDLDRVWGALEPAIRDHLENLMDEYDLVYKTSGHEESSIVVEALPPARDEAYTISMPVDRPRTEIIYAFPALVRHLPPGVPTWAFARAHRFLKPGSTLWRNAAQFEDLDTDSEASIFSSEAAREVRLRVASDYPPYFLGVLDSILRDTFRRYPGVQPEIRIPCPCVPTCKHGHSRRAVLKRKREGKADITCPLSGEDVAISRLLEGFFPADTKAAERAQLADLRRQLLAIQNAQNEELTKDCPSVFTLAPARGFQMLDSYLEYATQEEELELTLYCEWEKQRHPTQHSVYRFRPEQQWFVSLKEKWNELLKATKQIAPLAGLSGAVVGIHGLEHLAEIGHKAEKLSVEGHKDAAGDLAKELGARSQAGLVDLETRHLLSRLVRHLDDQRLDTQPKFGGLHGYHLRQDGRLLWLCPDHRRLYDGT